MRRFIFGERSGIYIIDLQQTLPSIDTAYSFVGDLSADGGTILFIGTKKQAQDPIQEQAERSGMPYVNQRWLGGMLTNFETIAKRVAKMQEYQRMRDSGEFEAMPKKEALILGRELEKLERNLSGIRAMTRRPDAVFVLDTKKEHLAVAEANKLGIPVVAVVDTNCDPDLVQYVIPGNDDAIRASHLMCRVIADAVIEGRYIASKRTRPPRRRQPRRCVRPRRRRRSARTRPRPAGRRPPRRPSVTPACPPSVPPGPPMRLSPMRPPPSLPLSRQPPSRQPPRRASPNRASPSRPPPRSRSTSPHPRRRPPRQQTRRPTSRTRRRPRRPTMRPRLRWTMQPPPPRRRLWP